MGQTAMISRIMLYKLHSVQQLECQRLVQGPPGSRETHGVTQGIIIQILRMFYEDSCQL
uniref:Uncharacterized protein n=1 Tax=Ciona intestinalis TaxID=7719 RepID=H2XVF1_CIOIN